MIFRILILFRQHLLILLVESCDPRSADLAMEAVPCAVFPVFKRKLFWFSVGLHFPRQTVLLETTNRNRAPQSSLGKIAKYDKLLREILRK
jgi:hypothetical protein